MPRVPIDGLAQRIKAMRLDQGLTQAQLGAVCGVETTAVSRWERDAATPDLASLVALSECFGVTLDELVKGEHPGDGIAPDVERVARRLSAMPEHTRKAALAAAVGVMDAITEND